VVVNEGNESAEQKGGRGKLDSHPGELPDGGHVIVIKTER